MSDWQERSKSKRGKIMGEWARPKSRGGDMSLAGVSPRNPGDYAELLDKFDDNRSPEDVEFLKDVLAYPNRADLGQEGQWPSGEEYPTEEDLVWMFNWLTERAGVSKQGVLKKLLNPNNPVDNKYRNEMTRAEIERRR